MTIEEEATNERLIASIPKNAREEIRISLDQFNGHQLFNVTGLVRDGTTARCGRARPASRFKAEKLPDSPSAVLQPP